MKINMNNDAGWTGSGGPWNTPESSMQKLVSASLAVQGPGRCEEMLSPPDAQTSKSTYDFLSEARIEASRGPVAR